jgi:hypothetical protein
VAAWRSCLRGARRVPWDPWAVAARCEAFQALSRRSSLDAGRPAGSSRR